MAAAGEANPIPAASQAIARRRRFDVLVLGGRGTRSGEPGGRSRCGAPLSLIVVSRAIAVLHLVSVKPGGHAGDGHRRDRADRRAPKVVINGSVAEDVDSWLGSERPGSRRRPDRAEDPQV